MQQKELSVYIKLIQKENDGKDIRVVYPMFVSTTDDTTTFAFEGAVIGKGSQFIIKKNENSTWEQG